MFAHAPKSWFALRVASGDPHARLPNCCQIRELGFGPLSPHSQRVSSHVMPNSSESRLGGSTGIEGETGTGAWSHASSSSLVRIDSIAASSLYRFPSSGKLMPYKLATNRLVE